MAHSIKLPKKFAGRGAYGLYYLLNSRRGIKVSRGVLSLTSIKKNYQAVIESNQRSFWKQGIKNGIFAFVSEYLFLKMLEPTGSVPKPYYLTWIKKSGGWSIGIVMKHINGVGFDKLGTDIDNKKHCYFKRTFTKKSKEAGLGVYDWNSENTVLSKSGKIYRIDFSATFIDVVKSKKEFYQNFKDECARLIDSL